METTYEKKGYLLENFRLFHLKDTQGTKIDYHYHEFHKLLFLISGNGSYVIEGQRYLLKPGDIVLVGSHCSHKPEFEQGIPYERMILYISPEFLEKESSEDCSLSDIFSKKHGPVLRLAESQILELQSLTKQLEKELSGNRYGRIILSNGLLLRILVELGRLMTQENIQIPEPILPKDNRILEILHYLDQHLTEELLIDELSEKFYISKYHMMRRFHEETGSTIHTYISERRLFMARNLIYKGIPATEACFCCGFGSYSSFSRAYGKLFGKTPTGKANISVVEETYE